VFKGMLRQLQRAALLVNAKAGIIICSDETAALITKWRFEGIVQDGRIRLTQPMESNNSTALKAMLSRLQEHDILWEIDGWDINKTAVFALQFRREQIIPEAQYGFSQMCDQLRLVKKN